MKEYKLIKEYPTSPKLGTIVKLKTSALGEKYYSTDDKSSSWTSHPTYIESQPEYWQEIVKDYEILERRSKNGTIFYRDGEFFKSSEGLILDPNVVNYCQIHSVRRSDGAIFTVGDTISHYLHPHDEPTTIKSIHDNLLSPFGTISFNDSYIRLCNARPVIYITADNIEIFNPSQRVYYIGKDQKTYEVTANSQAAKENKCYSTKQLAKDTRKVILTTADGVDLYVGDTYYFVDKDSLTVLQRMIVQYNIKYHSDYSNVRFSNIAAASEYLIKPFMDIITAPQNRWLLLKCHETIKSKI